MIDIVGVGGVVAWMVRNSVSASGETLRRGSWLEEAESAPSTKPQCAGRRSVDLPDESAVVPDPVLGLVAGGDEDLGRERVDASRARRSESWQWRPFKRGAVARYALLEIHVSPDGVVQEEEASAKIEKERTRSSCKCTEAVRPVAQVRLALSPMVGR